MLHLAESIDDRDVHVSIAGLVSASDPLRSIAKGVAASIVGASRARPSQRSLARTVKKRASEVNKADAFDVNRRAAHNAVRGVAQPAPYATNSYDYTKAESQRGII